MTKTPAELAVMEDVKDRYRLKLQRLPQLADRIISHVDEGRPLGEGLHKPIDKLECELVYGLINFQHADEGRQVTIVELARQSIARRSQ